MDYLTILKNTGNVSPRSCEKSELSEKSPVTVAELEPERLKQKQIPWPRECREAEERFGQAHARLFPFIGKRVWTPEGMGTLLSVFADLCEILPEGATKTIRVRTEDVRPIQ